MIQPDKKTVQELAALFDANSIIRLPMVAQEAWAAMAYIQLACRHPGATGTTRILAEKVARRIQQIIARPGTRLGELAEAGWHSVNDLPVSEPTKDTTQERKTNP